MVHPLLIVAFTHAVHGGPAALASAAHKAIGIPLAFAGLVVFFGVILGLMMLVGHLHDRRQR